MKNAKSLAEIIIKNVQASQLNFSIFILKS